MCFATAYEECRKERRYLDLAVELLEMVAGQEYDIPASSRLLSKLYLMSEDYERRYEALEGRVGEIGIVQPGDVTADRILMNDGVQALNQLRVVVARQFDLARKMSNGGLFTGNKAEVNARLQQHLVEQNLTLDSSVATVLLSFWQDMKQQLSSQYLALASKFGIPVEKFALGAKRIDAAIQGDMKGYYGSWANFSSSKDRAIHQHQKVNLCFRKAKEDFVEDVVKVVSGSYDVRRYENIEKIKDGVFAIERHISDLTRRNGIQEDSGVEAGARDVFSMSTKIIEDGTVCSWNYYRDDPAWGEKMIKGRKSFRIKVENVMEVFEASRRLEADMELQGQKVRVYTQGNLAALSDIPTAATWAAHRTVSVNPDYELIRYFNCVDAKYMHEGVGDIGDDNNGKEKVTVEVKDAFANAKRVLCEIWGYDA